MLKLSDVLTYLLEWHDRQTPLRILLSTPDGKFAFDCRLVRFFDTGISLRLAGDSDFVDLNLTGYDFAALNDGTEEQAHEGLSGNGRGLKANSSDRTLLIVEMISVSS